VKKVRSFLALLAASQAALSFSLMALWAPAAQSQPAHSVYSTRLDTGLDSRLMVQAPKPDSIQVVPMAQGHALKVTINRTDDYSRVANGVPRAEVSFGTVCRFARGTEYLIRWGTFIAPEFEFDNQQPEGLAQIHEGARAGSPPFGLNLNGSNYEVRVQGKQGNTVIGNAAADKGKWVQWSLRYKPDERGPGAITELYKDNKIVFNGNGTANAWPNDDSSYFKIGIYKWWWQSRPSNVTLRTIYFGDVSIAER
jgi:hypothetical protein